MVAPAVLTSRPILSVKTEKSAPSVPICAASMRALTARTEMAPIVARSRSIRLVTSAFDALSRVSVSCSPARASAIAAAPAATSAKWAVASSMSRWSSCIGSASNRVVSLPRIPDASASRSPIARKSASATANGATTAVATAASSAASGPLAEVAEVAGEWPAEAGRVMIMFMVLTGSEGAGK